MSTPPKVVQRMMLTPGLYLASVKGSGQDLVGAPILVLGNGKVYQLARDGELSPNGWPPDTEIRGPLTFDSPLF